MGKYGEKAVALHDEKYNCTQSVVLAFCDEIGVDKDVLARLALNAGGGFGYAGEACGTISGMAMVSGFLSKWDGPKDMNGKKESYDTIKELVKEFNEKTNYTRCPDLINQRKAGGPTCSDLCAIAADLVAKKMGLE